MRTATVSTHERSRRGSGRLWLTLRMTVGEGG
jgi:hypothetical protein